MVRVTLTKQQFDAVCDGLHPYVKWGAYHRFGTVNFFVRSYEDFDYLMHHTRKVMREGR